MTPESFNIAMLCELHPNRVDAPLPAEPCRHEWLIVTRCGDLLTISVTGSAAMPKHLNPGAPAPDGLQPRRCLLAQRSETSDRSAEVVFRLSGILPPGITLPARHVPATGLVRIAPKGHWLRLYAEIRPEGSAPGPRATTEPTRRGQQRCFQGGDWFFLAEERAWSRSWLRAA
jgi:hypothetical protein